MRDLILIGILTILLAIPLAGQEHQRYWIFFDSGDYHESVSAGHVDAVLSITDSVTVRSQWLNAVSVPATVEQLEAIKSLPFVSHIRPVARMSRPQPVPEPGHPDGTQDHPLHADSYYGVSETQIKMHGIDVLHNAGITGEGVRIGFLDTGFEWSRHEALMNANVIAERDFVAEHYSNDQLPPAHYVHGTLVFSVVAGYDPGSFVGVAHDAQFLLGATEDIRSETPIEEDFWVAGIEWMDEIGVDIVSTSLGYSIFDPPYPSYSPEDMDGNTAVTTIAADMAFERGIMVVASAGNSGETPWRIITAPADGRFVVAAGAVRPDGSIASFSSRGPSADGRIKPDVSAMGVGVWRAQVGTSGYTTSSGTSLSAPLVSGTAGLILSARPDLTAAELRNALRLNAGRTGEPDNTFGYGILNAPDALSFPVFRALADGSPALETFLVAADGIIEESVTLHVRTSNSTDYSTYPLEFAGPPGNSTSGLYRYILDPNQQYQSIYFIITAHDSSGTQIRYPRDTAYEYFLSPVYNLISIVTRVIPDRFVLHQNFPNPFNDRTVIQFELPHDDRVTIRVYDVLGRRVDILTDEFYLAGVHDVVWVPRSRASGIYFYSIRFGETTAAGRMVYLR